MEEVKISVPIMTNLEIEELGISMLGSAIDVLNNLLKEE